MTSNGNYPLMTQSEYDKAPFNEQDPPTKMVNVCCSQSLSRENSIIAEYDEYEEEFMHLANDYMLNHETPLSLIKEFMKCLKSGKFPDYPEYWIKECKHWNEDETEVVES